MMTEIANVDRETFWAHQSWPSLADRLDKERVIVVVPFAGYADWGLGHPLDLEEIVGMTVLRRAVEDVKGAIPILVVPPLRFVLGPYGNCAFTIDPETAYQFVVEVVESIHLAGFRKVVLFNTSPWSEDLINKACARDLRIEFGLQIFSVNLYGLGLDFHPVRSGSRRTVQTLGTFLLNREPSFDADPSWRIPSDGLSPGEPDGGPILRGFQTLEEAGREGPNILRESGGHLGRLLREIGRWGESEEESVGVGGGAGGRTREGDAVILPRYREIYLPAMNREQIDAIPRKDRAIVIVTIGAIEQHGPHLPVGVDAILGQTWLNLALPKVSKEVGLYVAPPITIGKSDEHIGFPGTLMISGRTLGRLLRAIARQLSLWGFRNLAVINTHGGNDSVLRYTLREIQADFEMRTTTIPLGWNPPLSRQEDAYGFHANEMETSCMLEAAPDLVDMSKAVCEYPADVDDPGELRPEDAPATFAWKTRDLSRSGVIGDATAASAEKGREWVAQYAESLARQIEKVFLR